MATMCEIHTSVSCPQCQLSHYRGSPIPNRSPWDWEALCLCKSGTEWAWTKIGPFPYWALGHGLGFLSLSPLSSGEAFYSKNWSQAINDSKQDSRALPWPSKGRARRVLALHCAISTGVNHACADGFSHLEALSASSSLSATALTDIKCDQMYHLQTQDPLFCLYKASYSDNTPQQTM
jgi:hypothetical protein